MSNSSSARFARSTGLAVEIAQSYADAVKWQSAVVNCGVNSETRQIVCMVAEGITSDSAERFADHLAEVALRRGMPGSWAVIMVHEER